MKLPNSILDRRSFLELVAAGLLPGAAPRDISVPWSSGTEQPKTKAPANAADCHHHIYDSRFPMDPAASLRPPNATVADYRLLQKRLGTSRNVVVQPSTYGLDNRCLLDALAQFGSSSRGIAVVNTRVQDSELKRLHDSGVRGIRFNLVQAVATTLDMVEPLAKRVATFGWHIQINASAPQIAAASDLWNRLPCPLVFDHLAHAMHPDARDSAFVLITRMLQNGRAWVKLSGGYMDTKVGPPTYADRGEIAKAYIKEAPERLVWGTDWPHPTTANKPDDAILFDLLSEWASDEATRRRILVDNPAKLYGYS